MKEHRPILMRLFFCILAAVLLFLPSKAHAQTSSGICGDGVNWTLTDGGALRISGTGEMTAFLSAYEIPADSIHTITIDSGVTSVAESAFAGCTALERVSIGNGVETVHDLAFDGCWSLCEVSFGDSITSIGNYAFSGCAALTEVILPDRVTQLGTGAFYYCTGLAHLELPDALTQVGDIAFGYCNALETVCTGNGLAELSCFTFGSTLKSIELGEGIRQIKKETFAHCPNLKRVVLGSKLDTIGDSAFFQCSSLRQINLPDSLISIGSAAFYGCSALTSLRFPDNLLEIGRSAFIYCTGLTSLTLPDKLTSLGEMAFHHCDNVRYIHTGDGITDLTPLALVDKLQVIEIGSSVTAIQNRAFYCLPSLRNVTIGSGVTYIGRMAFYSCSCLSTVVIGSNVTKIDHDAFSHCTALSSIHLPAGLTYLGSGVFSGCTGLTGTVTIPDSVTYLDGSVFVDCIGITGAVIGSKSTTLCDGQTSLFSGCTSLSHVTIKSGVTYIGSGCFSDCTSLTTISIPDSVMTIKDYAFSHCSALTNISLPYEGTLIGAHVFQYCSSLTCITIPEGCVSIAGDTFLYCTSLARVTIPVSVTCIIDGAFSHCPSLKVVYYNGTKSQWQQVKDRYYVPFDKIYFGAGRSGSRYYDVPREMYNIHVVDSNNRPIAAAAVRYGDQVGTTDSNGNELFTLITASSPLITVTREGYLPYSSANTGDRKSESRYETIVLYRQTEADVRLLSVLYSPNEDGSDALDLLHHAVTVSLVGSTNCIRVGKPERDTFYLDCKVTDVSGIKVFELWQGNTRVAESARGRFTLDKKSFSTEGSCYIYVKTKDARKFSTGIRLYFSDTVVNGTNSLSLSGSGLSLDVADTVPYLGGTTVNIDLPDALPVDFYLSDSGVRVGINLLLCSTGNLSDEKNFSRWWQNQKSTMSRVRALSNASDILTPDTLRSILKQEKTMKLPGGQVSVSIVGYAENDLNSLVSTGELFFFIQYQTRIFGYQTVVGFVPVTVQLKGTVDARIGGQIFYDWSRAILRYSGKVGITTGLHAFGGVGAGEAVGVGVYGRAGVLTEFLGGGTEKNFHTDKVDLTGELGLKAYLACFSYEKAFAYQTWHLYTADDPLSDELEAGDSGGVSFEREDPGYLACKSEWLGDRLQLMDDSASPVTLVENTYHNPEPVLVSGADCLYAAFIQGDTDGNSYVMVTKFEGGLWSQPVRAAQNSICDSAPTLCLDSDGTLWLAYCKTGSGFDGSTLLSFAQNQTIVVGTVNCSTLAFTPAAELSGTGYLHLPRFTAGNGAPVLVWLESAVSSQSEVIAPPATQIRCVRLNGSLWSDGQTLTQVNCPVVQLCPAEAGGALSVGYITDTDGDTATQTDRTLYILSEGTAVQSAQGVTGKLTFGILPGENCASFLWNSADSLCSSGGASVQVPGITGEYVPVDNRVFYSAAGDAGSRLTAVEFFADGSQSEALQLTAGDAYVENLCAAQLGGTAHVLALRTDALITDDGVLVSKDLIWYVSRPLTDLRLTGLDYAIEGLTAGENTTVTVTVKNAGQCPVSDFTVLLNGETLTRGGALAVGESRELTLQIPCPAGDGVCTITVLPDGAEENSEEDNTTRFTLGYGDLAVALDYDMVGDSRILTAQVTNRGAVPIGGTMAFYDELGASFAETELEAIEPGQCRIMSLTLAEDFAVLYGGIACVRVTAAQEEPELSNNTAYVMIPQWEDKAQILSCDQDKTIRIYVENTGTIGAVLCVFYDENGRMLSAHPETPEEGANTYTYQADDNACLAKVLLLDQDNVPILSEQCILFS